MKKKFKYLKLNRKFQFNLKPTEIYSTANKIQQTPALFNHQIIYQLTTP